MNAGSSLFNREPSPLATRDAVRADSPRAATPMTSTSRPPHWLSGGFRPFFLLGALAMALSVLAWIPFLLGLYQIPTAFMPRDWHVHTMLFGGVMAIVAGFALTAVSNWTGRPQIAGRELLLLVLLWLAGRVAVSTSAVLGAGLAAVIDLLFPLALTFGFAREVVLAGNYRNLRVVGIVALLGAADLAFHIEAARNGMADYALRAAIALVLTLIMLIGGRIVPAFTRNWLVARGAGALPAPFSRVEGAVMAISAAALAAWVLGPSAVATGVLLIAAGLANAVRLSRWCGWSTRSEPLLFILHFGFATLAAGFLVVGASALRPDLLDSAAMVHVWTAGTIGVMTLAVMTRASRGHSGRHLKAGRLEMAIFVLVLLGTGARLLAPYAGGWTTHALECATLGWTAAYIAFAAGYARMLLIRPSSG